jgi:hypothetical protein
VVEYQQAVFLPVWEELLSCTCSYTIDGNECLVLPPPAHRLVVWNHDESTYYANDHCKIRWVHKTEMAVPHPKGKGLSLMVANFISPDYGWLQSPDGAQKARVIFKASKNHEGYFTHEVILKQVLNAMDILQQHHADEDHILVFDNATTHLKHADDALSVRHMPKFSPRHGSKWDGTDWGTWRKPKNNVIDANGKSVH